MKYEPKVHPDNRNHHVNAGFVIEDLQHCEECLAEVTKLVSAVFSAPGGSESVDSEEYSNAMEELRSWNEQQGEVRP
jgi:hypothetical protein